MNVWVVTAVDTLRPVAWLVGVFDSADAAAVQLRIVQLAFDRSIVAKVTHVVTNTDYSSPGNVGQQLLDLLPL